jgi:hypothetical protein
MRLEAACQEPLLGESGAREFAGVAHCSRMKSANGRPNWLYDRITGMCLNALDVVIEVERRRSQPHGDGPRSECRASLNGTVLLYGAFAIHFTLALAPLAS